MITINAGDKPLRSELKKAWRVRMPAIEKPQILLFTRKSHDIHTIEDPWRTPIIDMMRGIYTESLIHVEIEVMSMVDGRSVGPGSARFIPIPSMTKDPGLVRSQGGMWVYAFSTLALGCAVGVYNGMITNTGGIIGCNLSPMLTVELEPGFAWYMNATPLLLGMPFRKVSTLVMIRLYVPDGDIRRTYALPPPSTPDKVEPKPEATPDPSNPFLLT